MKAFRKYVEKLDVLLDEIEWGNRIQDHASPVENSLNGEASEILHRIGNSKTIWRNGAYFTSQRLADQAIWPVTKQIDGTPPSCL